MTATDIWRLPQVQTDIAAGGWRAAVTTGGFCRFQDPPTNFPHRHADYHEFCYVCAGCGRYRHGDADFSLSPGTVFISDLDVVHEISAFQTRDLALVFFQVTIRGTGAAGTPEARLMAGFQQQHQVCAGHRENLSAYLPLLAGAADRSFFAERLAALFVLEIMAALGNKGAEIVNAETAGAAAEIGAVSPAFAKAQRCIAARAAEPLRAEEVAAAACCSPRQLRRLFQAYLGHGVREEIAVQKMNIAAGKLLMGFSAAQAAAAVGIEEPAQFSRAFRRVYGAAPHQWQQRSLQSPPGDRRLYG